MDRFIRAAIFGIAFSLIYTLLTNSAKAAPQPVDVMAPRCATVAELLGLSQEAYINAYPGKVSDVEWLKQRDWLVGFIAGAVSAAGLNPVALAENMIMHKSCVAMRKGDPS